MQSASTWWSITTGDEVPLYNPATRHSKQPRLHPIIANILQQRKAWKQPKDKRIPYTFDMFRFLHGHIARAASTNASFVLGLEAAIFDWSCLGIFTGSRLSEYGQSKPSKAHPFAVVPSSEYAAAWAGKPIAFIWDDFLFYDLTQIQIDYPTVLSQSTRIKYVHICFRFDKGPENFVTKKFKCLHGLFLCPVKATISILHRASHLGVPSDFPIRVFRPSNGRISDFVYIKGDHVMRTMRWACIEAHPDPDHFMHCNIHLLHSHLNRITAAVALHNADVPMEIITARLRWSVESVKF